jgi:hypothetical protein
MPSRFIRPALTILALSVASCASSQYRARYLHSDSREPISGIAVHLEESTGRNALNGWPTMERIDRGTQVTDVNWECMFIVDSPAFCQSWPTPFYRFDYSDKPSDYIEKETGVYVYFVRPILKNKKIGEQAVDFNPH